MEGRMDGWMEEWAGVGLITTGYPMLPQDAACYLYRYV